MNSDIQARLAAAAEDLRSELGDEFFVQQALMESDLEAGRWPAVRRTRSGEPNKWSLLSAAAFKELHALLCTSDPRYDKVREHADDFVDVALPLVAGYVATALALTTGVATAGVAFVALGVFRVGTGVFCRIVAADSSHL